MTGTDESTAPLLLRQAAGWTWRILVLALGGSLLLLLLVRLRFLVLAVLAALLLAALLHPLYLLMRRARMPSGLAALLTVLVLVGSVGTVVAVVSMGVASQLDGLGESVSSGLERVREWLVDGPAGLDRSTLDDLRDQADSALGLGQGNVLSGVVGGAYLALEVLTSAGLALFTLFFLLKDGPRFWGFVVGLFSAEVRPEVEDLGELCWGVLAGYVRGTLLIAVADAVFIGIGLVVIGVPLVLPLSLLVLVGAFVPIVGATVAGTACVLVALVDGGVVDAALVLGVVILVQQVEGNVLQPVVMRRAVALHPLVTVLAVAVGTSLAGIAGAVVAVPVTAVASAAVHRLGGRRRRRARSEGLLRASGPVQRGRPPDGE